MATERKLRSVAIFWAFIVKEFKHVVRDRKSLTILLGLPVVMMTLFGFALSRLIYASFANGVFDKYLNPNIEGAQVGQGLRPRSEDDDLPEDDEDDDGEDE